MRISDEIFVTMIEVLQAIRRKVKVDEPPSGRLNRASVAVALKDAGKLSLLLIKRADRADDPWSGQIALPGGRAREGDLTLRDTAIRETLEEVGIDLRKDASFVGYTTPFMTHTGSMEVFPAVFLLEKDVDVRPNDEVSSFRWIELEKLMAEQSKSKLRVNLQGETMETSALIVDDYSIWGLTHRIITFLLS